MRVSLVRKTIAACAAIIFGVTRPVAGELDVHFQAMHNRHYEDALDWAIDLLLCDLSEIEYEQTDFARLAGIAVAAEQLGVPERQLRIAISTMAPKVAQKLIDDGEDVGVCERHKVWLRKMMKRKAQ